MPLALPPLTSDARAARRRGVRQVPTEARPTASFPSAPRFVYAFTRAAAPRLQLQSPDAPGRSARLSSVALSKEFRALFDAEFGFVCRTLRRLGVREADVCDVAQELFVTAHAAYAEFDPTRSARGWLFGYARGYASNYRKLGWHKGREIDDQLPRSSPRLGDKLDARAKVAIGLAALDEDKQTVLILHDMEGLGAPEISATLGVPLNTVYSRIRLAREAFKVALQAGAS